MITLESLFIDAPSLTANTEVSEVIPFLDQHDYSHLALVDSDNKWVGTIATDVLYDVDETEKIANLQYRVESFFVYTTDDLAKMADAFILNTCNLLPVLDEDMHLKGMLPKTALTENLLESTFLTEPGTTLILEVRSEAYSLSTVVQLVESNNAKLLGILVLQTKDHKTQLLLRLNQKNIEAIIQDFRRFDFEIISQHDEDLHQNKLIEHSNYLNKFLNL